MPRKLAWSKYGCIAYISKDNRNVIIQHLLCDPHNGRSKLSKEYVVDDIPQYHAEGDLVHVSWSHSGNDLAVIDRLGRISICSIYQNIMNRMAVVRRCTVDPEDDLGAIVGLTWLHLADQVLRLQIHPGRANA